LIVIFGVDDSAARKLVVHSATRFECKSSAVQILAHRERQFRTNVNADSDRC
jgi:hypothetical protein